MRNEKAIQQLIEDFADFQEYANENLELWKEFEKMGFPSIKTPEQLYQLMTAPGSYINQLKTKTLEGQKLELNGLTISAEKLAAFVEIPQKAFAQLEANLKTVSPKIKTLIGFGAIINGKFEMDDYKFAEFKKAETITPASPKAKAKFEALKQFEKAVLQMQSAGIETNIWAFPYRTVLYNFEGEPTLRFDGVKAVIES